MSAGLLCSRPPLSSLCFLHFIAPSSILLESLTITHQSTCLPLSGQSIRSIISMPPPESPTSVRRESLYNGGKKIFSKKYRHNHSDLVFVFASIDLVWISLQCDTYAYIYTYACVIWLYLYFSKQI